MPLKKEVYILEHVASEKSGAIGDYLKKEKIPYREIQLYKNNYAFPGLGRARALVVMGGPMNVYEEDKYSFLAKENHFIRSAVKAGIPYLGICLGAQLLAKALGARVYKAKAPEIGWGDVILSARARQDALLKSCDEDRLKVLQWHEDTFDLPSGAALLASSQTVPNQAYVCAQKFYGFQFHFEVNRKMLEVWFRSHPQKDKILTQYSRHRAQFEKTSGKICSAFFNL